MDRVILLALDRLSQSFKTLLWDQAKEKKLSPIQIQFLVHIGELPEGKSTVGKIAREFNLTPPTVSDAVKTLENKGLIYREVSEADRRRSFLKLTDSGLKTYQSLHHWDHPLLERINDFPLQTKETVLIFLLELLESLKTDENLPQVSTCLSCGHFERNSEKNEISEYHLCLLRNVTLENIDLRLNCPNYKKITEAAS